MGILRWGLWSVARAVWPTGLIGETVVGFARGCEMFRGKLNLAVLVLAVVGLGTWPAGAAEAPQRVSFQSSDGVTIVGDYYGPASAEGRKAPIVILLHMYPSDRTSWRGFAPKLAGAGLAALAIDMRGHGESVKPAEKKLASRRENRDPRLYRAMYRDVAAAYTWLSQQPNVDPARFAIVGASIGCSVAIDYARRDRSVDVVACLSPGTNYLGVNTVAHIKAYGNRPILLVASDLEQSACRTLAGLTPGATVKIYPAAGRTRLAVHGTNLLSAVREVEPLLLEFVRTHVGDPSDQPVVASIHSNVFHQPDSPTVRRIKPANLRWFSSAAEARARGLRPPRRWRPP
ncbi:MAG: alpha/beta hydrolase [Phycisphaerae bacterium]